MCAKSCAFDGYRRLLVTAHVVDHSNRVHRPRQSLEDERGFRQRNSSCQPLVVPANAYIGYSGNDWIYVAAEKCAVALPTA